MSAPKRWKPITAGILVSAACLSFGAALAGPIFSVVPGAGELTPWLRAFKPDSMTPISQSLTAGVMTLWTDGDFVLAILLGLFCIVLPFFKFGVIWSSLLRAGMESTLIGRLIAGSSKYSMVEIFILAILAVVVKGLPGGSTMNLEPAAYYFIISVIFSLAAAFLIPTRFDKTKLG
jgi:paraquat-inducible protein A